jgi:ElaB/YqjD/DUF883 family membrane-anchored ribosome-binding protein
MSTVQSNIKSFQDKADDVRKRTADTLESAADSIRAAGNESADTIHDIANGAGKKLDSTAGFVRTACVKAPFGSGKILGSVRHSVRRNPVGSLAIAAAVGVVAGFSCRSSGR